ncbi:hypothetical protein J2W80_000164 [Methylorubrum extorquens]|nr:hypothetical protein [Methylorubrum extorquens]MCP1587110.1 hypothetical protein [Methylorubrum extorquens]
MFEKTICRSGSISRCATPRRSAFETLGIPEEWHRVSQVIQIILGFAFALALGSPALYLDQVIAALMQVRPK